MVSQLKVNEIIKQSGSSIVIGETGDTVSGPFTSTPSFFATSDASTTISNSTWVKVSVPTELFDTNSNYDASTSRFTPTVAGKYFFTATILGNSASVGQLRELYLALYKNGSNHTMFSEENLNNGYDEYRRTATGTAIDTANGTSDYYEIYTHINNTSGSPQVTGASQKGIKFGAYRMIGA